MPALQSPLRGLRVAMLASTVIISAACARNLSTGDPGMQEPGQIIFTNDSQQQADLFAVAPALGQRRLGTTFAGRTDTLRIPVELVTQGSLSLVARMFGGGTAGSGVIVLRSGESLRVRLPFDGKLLVVLPDS